MWYVGKFDEANWNLFARLGLTPSYLRESGRGMAAVQQTVTYKRELLAGDIVEVRSRLLELRDKSIRFLHEMRNGETGEIAAACEFVGVHTWTGRCGSQCRLRPRSVTRLKSISNRRWREPCRASSRRTRITARSRLPRSSSSGR
jgi:acyl-CoA thioesterase FadM